MRHVREWEEERRAQIMSRPAPATPDDDDADPEPEPEQVPPAPQPEPEPQPGPGIDRFRGDGGISGFCLGAVAGAVVINYLHGGSAQVKQWLRAKLFNETGS